MSVLSQVSGRHLGLSRAKTEFIAQQVRLCGDHDIFTLRILNHPNVIATQSQKDKKNQTDDLQFHGEEPTLM